MSFLIDVNVWVAIVLRNHSGHTVAKPWFDSASEPLVFCRMSQAGFLRVLSSPAVSQGGWKPTAVWDAYWRLQSDSRVTYEDEPRNVEARWHLITAGHSKTLISGWTDAYLAAFAIERGHSFVTFDKGFLRFPALDLTLLEA